MTTNIKRILLPTDFSESAQNAFRHCLLLAGRLKAEVYLLHVAYPEYAASDLPLMASKATKDKVAAAREVMQTFVDHGVAQANAAGKLDELPAIHPEVEVGSPGSVIPSVAHRNEVDLIVMGTRSRHNALEQTFGSVTTAVLNKARCHLWVIPSDTLVVKINVAAYATDLSETDPYHIWQVGKLLQPFSPVLHCVHVRIAGEQEKELDLAELESFFADRAPSLQINFHDVPGMSVVDRLDEFAVNYEVDLLVMYAPHYSWLERLFFSSKTRWMALHARAPVLFLRGEI